MASSITGFDEWQRLLEGFAERGSDLRPAAGAIHKDFLDDMADGHIPVDSGRLRDSLTNASSPDHIWKESSTSVEMGTRDPAALFARGFEVPEVDGNKAAQSLANYVFHKET